MAEPRRIVVSGERRAQKVRKRRWAMPVTGRSTLLLATLRGVSRRRMMRKRGAKNG